MPVTQQADALLLEGWLVGYDPCGVAAIDTWLNNADHGLDAAERAWLPHWDSALAAYQPLWAACDSFWVLEPLDWSVVLRWRLHAEAKQRRHGGIGLGSAALVSLVRASLASLPPALYQGALQARARAVAQLDRRRRCIAVQVP
jgi:D-glycerate 3-kinase